MTGMQNRKVKTKEAVEVIWNLFANHESMKGTKETNIKISQRQTCTFQRFLLMMQTIDNKKSR